MLIEPVIDAQLKAFRLGDKRLDDRCAQVQRQLLKGDTSQSFPQLFTRPYDLKAFYRLLHNPRLQPKAISRAYDRGLRTWISQQPRDNRYLFVFQDTTFGKYHNHSLTLGYLQRLTDNGILLHHGILADADFVPLGLPIQQIILRQEEAYGKSQERKQRPFEQKESVKWLTAFEWARKFERHTNRKLVQVCDREADIAQVLNAALKQRQAFIIASNHDRQLANSAQRLGDVESTLGEGELVERFIRDGKGRWQTCMCRVRYSRVPLKDITKPVWVVYLQQITPIQGQELAHWRLLTSLPVASLEDATFVLDAYRHRWPTCEDFHKCLKSGCSIEDRHLHTQEALFGAIGLLSLVAIALLRLRHLGQHSPERAASTLLEPTELAVADHLSKSYMSGRDLRACEARTVLWFVLLLGRLGGHQGVAQAGLPGWQTIWRGYRQFSLLVDGYIISKNEYYEQKPPT